MINIFSFFKNEYTDAIKKIAAANNVILGDEDLARFTVEPTKERSHGDLACNAAMILAKKFKFEPIELARLICEELKSHHLIARIEPVKQGFINIFLQPQIFFKILQDLAKISEIEFVNLGMGKKVNLEYASPNPTGPIHIGHTRGAIYGDVLAKLLQKTGFDVLKEYYINDAGAQIKTLLKSAFIRYQQALGLESEISDGLYPGDYLIEIGHLIKEKFGDELLKKDEESRLALIRDLVVEKMLEMIKSDLLALGIKHDYYFSEKKELHDKNKIAEAVSILRNKGLIYQGKLEVPKTEKGVGALPEGYDDQEQTLFRSTNFGDDQDRVVFKADGSATYFAADIAYAKSKFERGAKIFIMPLGFDHAGYVKRLKAVVDSISEGKAELKVVLCQMVKFVKNGEPLKMSKRAGNFITAAEVVAEVGADALRFIMLTRKNDAPFDFDLAKVIEQSKDNPIFYVQYAHARCCSVLRMLDQEMPELAAKIGEKNGFDKIEINFPNLEQLDDSESELMKKIANFPRIIEMAVLNYEPHRLAFYLQELSAEFHAFWNKGSEDHSLKFIIKDNQNKTAFRIMLLLGVQKVIAAGLDIFNIRPAQTM